MMASGEIRLAAMTMRQMPVLAQSAADDNLQPIQISGSAQYLTVAADGSIVATPAQGGTAVLGNPSSGPGLSADTLQHISEAQDQQRTWVSQQGVDFRAGNFSAAENDTNQAAYYQSVVDYWMNAGPVPGPQPPDVQLIQPPAIVP
jgi:hypothetical protein